MARRTVSETELLGTALDLFRTHGAEGVSLSQLSQATGLEKASLYYRFPGGKEEIILAALAHVGQWFETCLFPALRQDGPPRKRAAKAAEILRAFYQDGSRSCVTDVLSLPGGSPQRHQYLQTAMESWVEAFTALARESGHAPAAARHAAEDAIIRIEGSLVMARALGSPASFHRVLKQLPDLLTKR
jgi:TetR/AcrR family transcriptional repressor of lmrAB and yxaGH operons